ncbi:helix-turn-helix transcriptional regulator [Sphingomonas pituitosa]|uniref:helix-turn-helix transcriptional regulator n=1 Tax=Sphingomonas pituitosa TaxID=99597 RepID=UPI00083451D8|nr:YafY family protein [Sphingomonas pituitosa]
MARSHRLFDLLQVLRRHRRTVSGEALAQELGVSLRTIRRDIATLQAMGAEIDGEAGVGYILHPGFLLPPLSFTEDELHALSIGAQWVRRQTDRTLAFAVENAIAKINAVLPAEMRPTLDADMVYVGRRANTGTMVDLGEIRRALRNQRKVSITLRGEQAYLGRQIIWPVMLGLIDGSRYISAWCEGGGTFRIISMEDIEDATILDERYPGNRKDLVREWRSKEVLPCNGLGDSC